MKQAQAGLLSPLLLVVIILSISGCGGNSNALPNQGPVVSGGASSNSGEEVADKEEKELGMPWSRLSQYQDKFIGSGYADWDRERDALTGIPIVATQWASWCTSCTEEAPILARAAAKYRGQVAFIAINALDQRRAAENFLLDNSFGMPQIEDTDGKIIENISQGGRAGLPRTTLISAEGRPVFTNIGSYQDSEALDADIEKFLLSRQTQNQTDKN